MVFSETTNRTGLIQLLEDLTNTQSSSSTSYPLAVKTRDINSAFDEYQNYVKRTAGTWQADDTNHTKYPNMKFNLSSTQQDYTFTVDEQGNQVQDIYRVEIKNPSGVWVLLTPYDEFMEDEAIGYRETLTGTPERYYKTANGIFLDVTPNYSSTLGIRMFYTRSPSYFLTTDTTKAAGIPNGHHRYLANKAAYWYWMSKDTAKANAFLSECKRMEQDIKGEYADRSRDEVHIITPEHVNSI